jgi:hypothetical protein
VVVLIGRSLLAPTMLPPDAAAIDSKSCVRCRVELARLNGRE